MGSVLVNACFCLLVTLKISSIQSRFKITEQQIKYRQLSYVMELYWNKRNMWNIFGSASTEHWPTNKMLKQQLISVLSKAICSCCITHSPLLSVTKDYAAQPCHRQICQTGQSANRGEESHTENHKGHVDWDRAIHVWSPTDTSNTERGIGHSTFECCRKSQDHAAAKDTKGSRLGRDNSWVHETSREVNTSSPSVNRIQANH